jgi:hypothetical protein
VTTAATEVNHQAKLLAKSPLEVFKEDISPFENSVKGNIRVNLIPEEFDALVSFPSI